MKLNQSQEVIEHMAKRAQNTGGENSPLQAKEGQNEQSTENEAISVRENSPLLKIGAISAEDEENESKWNIPHMIQYVITPSFGGANKGYIVCRELLHDCLLWADRVFAWDIYSFLSDLQEQDNEYLKRRIDELTQRCKDLKNRYVPDDDHWTYYLTYKIEDKTVYLYSQFCRMERWDIAYKEIEKNGRHELYRLNRLPNGCIFRSMAEKPLKEICEKYDGKAESVCRFSLPLKNWVDKDKRILASIRLQLKQVRIDLGWRTDLNNLNNE